MPRNKAADNPRSGRPRSHPNRLIPNRLQSCRKRAQELRMFRLLVQRRVLLVACLLLVVTHQALGASGPVIALPQQGTKIKSGLVMTLDFRGVDANGYRPVRVEARTLTWAPLAADRQLRVVLSPRGYNAAGTPE